jgi:predicted DNA-binding transcriptional regulator YafY
MPYSRPELITEIVYTNYRGETATRKILPIHIWFGKSPWHLTEQWFLEATDLEKDEDRSFAMSSISEWRCPSAKLNPEFDRR